MAERTNAFQTEPKASDFDTLEEATARVKADVEKLVEGFDIHAIAGRIEEFGRENPVGLALSALTLGVAVGVLMRGIKRVPNA